MWYLQEHDMIRQIVHMHTYMHVYIYIVYRIIKDIKLNLLLTEILLHRKYFSLLTVHILLLATKHLGG